jgi:hypothetical protein
MQYVDVEHGELCGVDAEAAGGAALAVILLAVD